MPTGLVQPVRSEPIPEADLAYIRWCLSRIRTDERPTLWAALDLVRTAAITANTRLLDRVVLDLPAGSPIQAVIADIARHRLYELRGTRQTSDGSGHHLTVRHAPSRRYHSVAGIVGSEGQWAPRPYWWTSHQDVDLTGAHRNGPARRPLLWQHRPHGVLGLSRSIWLEPNGDLRGEFDFGAYPTAQTAASLAADGAVGFSIGTIGGESRWLTEVGPDEWDPTTGQVDAVVRVGALLEEVSLTPSPLLAGTAVTRID